MDHAQINIAPILITSCNNQYRFKIFFTCDIQQVFVGYHEKKNQKNDVLKIIMHFGFWNALPWMQAILMGIIVCIGTLLKKLLCHYKKNNNLQLVYHGRCVKCDNCWWWKFVNDYYIDANRLLIVAMCTLFGERFI